MKHLIPLILIVIIILIPALALLIIRKETGLNQTSEGIFSYFSGEINYQASFISPKDNLSSLSLKIKNTSLENQKPVYFKLSTNTDTLRTVQINGSNIPNGYDLPYSDMVRFAFPVIKDSMNKKFFITLSSKESARNEEFGVFVDQNNNPVLITYHTPSSKLNQIVNIYSSLFNRVLADKFFIVIWLSFLASLFWLIVKKVND